MNLQSVAPNDVRAIGKTAGRSGQGKHSEFLPEWGIPLLSLGIRLFPPEERRFYLSPHSEGKIHKNAAVRKMVKYAG
jgi:hypothetical protein